MLRDPTHFGQAAQGYDLPNSNASLGNRFFRLTRAAYASVKTLEGVFAL